MDTKKIDEIFTASALNLLNETFDIITTTMKESDYLDSLHPAPTNGAIVIEYLKFLLFIIGIAVDILIICIYLLYKDMKKPVNTYIINWLVCIALFTIIDPSEYRVYKYLEDYKGETEVICVLVSCIVVIALVNALFMTILIFHGVENLKKIAVLDAHCCQIVTGVWIFAVIGFFVVTTPCVDRSIYGHLGELYLAITALIFITCFVIIHFIRRCANPFSATGSLPVALVSSYVMCWITMLINAVLYPFTNNWIFLILLSITQMILYLYPLIVFYLFYTIDRTFAIYTRKLFRKHEPDDISNCVRETEERHGNNVGSNVEI